MTLNLPELRTTDLDGPLSYRQWDGPEGATFVLAHGLGGSHLSWVQVADGLSGLGRVLAPDLQGFGATPLAGRSARLMDLRRTLDRFIAEHSTERVVLCGNSMGGALCILEAALQPDRIAGVVLTGSAFPRTTSGRAHPLIRLAFTVYDTPGLGAVAVRARMQSLTPERIVAIALRLTCADPKTIPADVVQAHVDMVRARMDDPETADAFIDAARSMLALGRRPAAIRGAFEAVRCPVLVLHGRRDKLVPARDAEAILARYPSWRGRFFPDLGHVPQMEAPGRWLSELADWQAWAT